MGGAGLVALIACALLAAGCGSSEQSSEASPPTGDAPVGGTLTIAQLAVNPNLNPAATPGFPGDQNVQLAYESLMRVGPGGKIEPGLALAMTPSEGNSQWQIKLRPDVKFSDGSAVTAQSVVNYLKYAKTLGSFPELLTVKSMTATGPTTVTIKLSAPNPSLDWSMSQAGLQLGMIIGPDGLAKPAALANTTDGAGPYMLDSASTILNNTYTYVPNPHYFAKDRQHYEKIVIKVIPNPNAALNAVKTGQVEVAQGDPQSAEAAKASGLEVYSSSSYTAGISLLDRGGQLVPALGDPRVRQALNLAVDREGITSAVYGSLGTPTAQIAVPETAGDVPKLDDHYPYDPEAAKRLLDEAGYGNGFTMTAIFPPKPVDLNMAQAIADEYKKIGVTLELKSEPTQNAYSTDVLSGKYPAYIDLLGGAGPVNVMLAYWYLPTGLNPFKQTDKTVADLNQKLIVAPRDQQEAIGRQIITHLTETGADVPITTVPTVYFSNNTVDGIDMYSAAANGSPDFAEITPAQ